MSVNYVRYQVATGRIVSHGSSVSEDAATAKFEGVDALLFVDGNGLEHYVSGDVLLDKVQCLAVWDANEFVADGVSEIVLSGLPIPCIVEIDGVDLAVDDGSLEFSADVEGEYRIVLDEPRYFRKQWIVEGV